MNTDSVETPLNPKEKPYMRTRNVQLSLLCLIASSALLPAAHAQWAVIDAPALAQLIQQVETTEQQLATARAQLLQAQQALQTTTGVRGMEVLLSGTIRNYLPPDWRQVTAALQGSNGYGGLSADVQNLIASRRFPASTVMERAKRSWKTAPTRLFCVAPAAKTVERRNLPRA
jgi:hypothetical protein